MKGQKQPKTARKFQLRSILALLLCALLALSAAGCSQEGGEDQGSRESQGSAIGSEPSAADTASTATGRYVETKLIALEEGSYYWNLDQVGDTLYLFGANGTQRSEDGGKTWEKFVTESPLASQFEKEGYTRGRPVYAPDGKILIMLTMNIENGDDFYSRCRYVLKEADGSEREIEVKLPSEENTTIFGFVPNPTPKPVEEPGTQLNNILFLADGTLVGAGMSHTIYHIDPDTGEILHTIPPASDNFSDRVSDIAATPTTLLILNEAKGRLFDLETWTPREDTEALDEFLLGGAEIQEDGSVLYKGGEPAARYRKLFSDGQEEAYYCFDSTGIYRYMPGGVTIEQLVDDTMNSIGFQDMSVNSFIKTKSHSFKALFLTNLGDNNLTYSILSYDYDPDALARPAQELKIYSLYPSDELDQAASVFQRENMDILVTYETGIDWENGFTDSSDALRQLNVEIMADKGPDVLVLDGMPIDNYQSKGLMVDVTDVVEEAAAENDLLRNITDVYAVDGKIYSVPASYYMPIVVGDKAVLEKITGLNSLAQTVKELREADKEVKSITGYRMPGGIMASTIGMLSPDWLRDGVVDWDIVGDYYDQMKLIYDAEIDTETEGDQGDGTEENPFRQDAAIYDDTAIGLGIIPFGESVIELRNMTSYKGLRSLYGIQEEHPEITYKVLEDNGVCGFTPTVILGVNARSGHQEEAKAFIKMMLEKDMQKLMTSQSNYLVTGLPVNFDVVREQFAGKEGEVFNEDYYSGWEEVVITPITKRNPTAAEIDEFRTMAQKLNRVSANQEIMVNNALLPNCAHYLEPSLFEDESFTKEEALQKAKEEIDLYLAES